MRFIEKSDSGLEAVIHYLRKSGGRLEFVLLPMLHLGTQEFYDEISRRLGECDLVLAEGINSRNMNFLTLPYRVAAKSWRLDLLRQDKALSVARFKDKIVKADLNGRSFDEGWSRLSLILRLQLTFISPVIALYLLFFVNRKKLAEHFLRKDSTLDHQRPDKDMEDFARLIGGDRNQSLIRHIKELDQSSGNKQIKIGIPYGAKHMSRISKFLLRRLGYRVIRLERIIVFDF